jgi:hydrogenase nickel incorporation protein HypB
MKPFELQKKVPDDNDRIAARLRALFTERRTLVVHLIGSPGAGKTALLERTLERWPRERGVAVLAGDLETENDAKRLARFGHPVRQICTEGECSLNAHMIERALAGWKLGNLDVLFIENVGNLVCPSTVDLGEHGRVVLLSVAEGEDEPLKYPATFASASALVLNKIDLLPHVPFDVRTARDYARIVHPDLEILETSCTTGAGLEEWMRWLEEPLRMERVNPAGIR